MTIENVNSTQLTFLRRRHAIALSASIGQGALRFCHCIQVDNASNTPAMAKIQTLCSDNAVIHGTALTNPAKTAPIPRDTNKAGSAQQISVPMLVKRLNVGIMVFRHEVAFGSLDTMNIFHVVA